MTSEKPPLERVPGESQTLTAQTELSPDVIEALRADTPLVPALEPLGARLASYFGRHQLLLFVASFFSLWAILSLPPLFVQSNLGPGKVAPSDFVTSRGAFLPDRTETRKRREGAAALVTPAYDPKPAALAQALAALPESLDQAKRQWEKTRKNQFLESLQGSTSNIPRDAGSAPRFLLVRSVAEDAVRAVYLKNRIRSDVRADLTTLHPVLKNATQNSNLTGMERNLAFYAAQHAARFPNVVVNERATELARRQARNAVLPVFNRIEANTPVVREGELITPDKWEQLQSLGLVAPRFEPIWALAHGAFCFILVSGAAAYIGRSRREILLRPAALWLLAATPVAFLLAFRLILGVPHSEFLLVPLAATAAMLLTVLLDTRVGLPAGFVVAALCALMAGADASLFLAATLSAWIGALSVARLANRFALVRSILLLSATGAVLSASVAVLRGAAPEELLSSAAWSALAGGASVVVMAGLAIFLERPFGITSHLRLLELLSPDELVIRRMQVEAPGTYTHSLMVSLLAEAGAKAVGADSLLCRVAGLYHDIGKLRRPHCFIENQSGDNIHDRLSPGLSALLIKAHVKDGLELGRAIRLPAPVLEILAAHHGTSLITYFYGRARAQSENGSVEEATYRYPGPKPVSKEAAIVMLADSVEASARALPEITPETLQTHIAAIVGARLSEGELSESDLSLREIGAVREAFLTTLRATMHGRISYPDATNLRDDRDWVRETLGEREIDRPRAEKNKAEKPAGEKSKIEKAKIEKDVPFSAPSSSDSSRVGHRFQTSPFTTTGSSSSKGPSPDNSASGKTSRFDSPTFRNDQISF